MFTTKNIHTAAGEGDIKAVKKYLKSWGNIEKRHHANGNTPLMFACQSGGLEMVKYLIRKGANVNHKNNEGFTPLGVACLHGQAEVVDYLISNGASFYINTRYNEDGLTPFFSACIGGNHVAVALLLERGASLTRVDKNGSTPLFFTQDAAVASLLVDRGANIHHVNEVRSGPPLQVLTSYQHGMTALLQACSAGHVEVAAVLIDRGADITHADLAGNNALHHACLSCHPGVIEILMKRNCDSTSRNQSGRTPLDILCLAWNSPSNMTAKALLSHYMSQGETPFSSSSRRLITEEIVCEEEMGTPKIMARVRSPLLMHTIPS